MISRRIFLATFGGGLLAAPLAAEAQRVGRIPRVGFLDPHSPSVSAPYHEAFRQQLRQLGYVEGQNIAIAYRFAQGNTERLPELAAELVRIDVDIIVAGAAPAVQAAHLATTTIPIVMVGYGPDPVKAGLVNSLGHPGGNITGSTLLFPEVTAKRLQLLRELLPRVDRVAVLWNPTNPAKVQDFRETETAARALGITLQSAEVQRADNFERTFGVIAAGHADALLVLGDPLTAFHSKHIVGLAAKHRLPSMYNERFYATDGGLVAYAPDLRDDFRRAALYVDRILKGAKPADLPIEQPTNFELVINLKTAKALGLTIPPSLLLRADQVIE